MTDKTNDQQKTGKSAPVRIWVWAFIILITLSIAIVGVLGAWYVWRDAEADRVRLLDTLDEMTIQLVELEKLKQSQAAISLHQDESASVLATLANRMDKTESQQSRLANLVEGGRRHWQVIEVEQLLLIANDRLQLHHDLVGTLHVLTIANQRLGSISEPRLLPTRKILLEEISALKAVPQIDVQSITLQLTTLISSTSGLPLATDLPRNFSSISSGQTSEAITSTGWQRLIDNLLSTARGMLQVRQADRPLVPLLPPEQAFFLEQNLMLKLETARLALLQRNTSLFRSSLDAAAGWLKAFYNVSDAGVQSAITELTELSRQDLTWERPDISRSLEALRSYMAQTSGSLSKAEDDE